MKNIAMKLRLLVALLAVALITTLASAVDKVHLKDGRVVEGTIIREVEGAVWIKTKVGGLETEQMFGSTEISKVERDAASTPAPAEPVVASTKADQKPSGSRVPKAAIISLGDNENGHMVGVFMTADILKRAVPLLEKELGTDRTGIVVLRVHSGGGLGLEVPKINDVIQKEYKTRWRTVGWIDSAISAAAMSMHGVEEIYFMTQGNYGGCVGFYGSFDKPVEGYELQKAFAQMEGISKQGNYHPLVMRAMQDLQPLSCTVKPTGEVVWYGDVTSGEIVVNREGEVLTFDSKLALKCKFSKGTADTVDELAKVMGYNELDWVGKKWKNYPYNVSDAEKLQIEFRQKTKIDQGALNSYYTTFQREIAAAASEQDPTRRGAFVGKAKQALEKIKAMVKNNPNFKLLIFNGDEGYNEFIKEAERIIKELTKR
jgi:hypothetical protein